MTRLVILTVVLIFVFIGLQYEPYRTKQNRIEHADAIVKECENVIGIGEYRNNRHFFLAQQPSTEQRLRPGVHQMIGGY